MFLKRTPLILAALFALAIPTAASAAESETVFGLTGAGGLVSFDAANPATVTVIGPITGLALGETVVGIDTQPSTGRLFAVTSASKVFTVSKTTAAATQVGTVAFTPAVATAATSFGVDFNPVPNAIRFFSSGAGANQSLRISPATGAVAGTDTAPPAATVIADAAYTNNVNGANSTTLYVIDTAGDLKRIGGLGGSPSPNGGIATTVGSLGVTTTGDVGFDISGATNTAYASLQTTPGTAKLATIDLASGQASALAPQIGAVPTNVIDIAVNTQPPSIQFSAAASAVAENAGTAPVVVTRTGNTDGVSNVTVSTTTTGTATADADFTPVAAQAVQFAAGETTKTVSIPIADDTAVESPETIAVSVALAATAAGASLGAPNAATVTVFDNDPTTVAGPNVPVATIGNQVLLSASPNRINRSSLINKGMSFTASCSEACVISYTLKIGSTVLGTTTAQRGNGGLVPVKLTLTDAGKSALNSALKAKRPASKLMRLEATATDSDGGAAATGAASIRVYRV